MALLTETQIAEMGFAKVGKDVRISDRASFYNCANITIGDHVRIDDFCLLSAGAGGIFLGSYIHIAVYTSLQGSERIELSDFCNISSRVAIYSRSDDYSGEFMTNPMVPAQFTGGSAAPVNLGRHVIVGSGSVILPGANCEDGVAIGALSLVNKPCEAFGIYAGNPARRIKDRKRNLLELEKQFAKNEHANL